MKAFYAPPVDAKKVNSKAALMNIASLVSGRASPVPGRVIPVLGVVSAGKTCDG